MEGCVPPLDNCSVLPDDLPLLIARVRELAAAPEDAPEPLLGEMEHTLTDGYARALALEGESLRIEKEIGEIVGRIKRGEQAGELPALAARLERTAGELAALRGVLDDLRRRVDRVRASSPEVATRSRS
jgi:hypothetical protein